MRFPLSRSRIRFLCKYLQTFYEKSQWNGDFWTLPTSSRAGLYIFLWNQCKTISRIYVHWYFFIQVYLTLLKIFGFHHFLLGSIPESCKLHCPEVFYISGKFSILHGEHFYFLFFFFSGWLSCSHAQPQSTPIPANQMLTVTAEMGAFPNGDTPLLPLNGVSC